IKNTIEAITLFFKSCIQRGTLDQALKELNWKQIFIPAEEQETEPALKIPRNLIPAFMIDQQEGNKWLGHVET
ncbi:MAG: hypothetical protein NT039_04845, partial [Candidatus Berkelbacteria bacterium]|nr:hypothetical protein [Candidatus Berkelbacteria bacterium]